MAIIAPRYNPTGNQPSAMPTPQVRAQSGLAEGIAVIGETIASLGRSAEYVKDTAARNEALVQQRADAATRASLTAGTHAAMVWKERNEARLSKLRQSRMYNAMGARQEFGKELETDTGDDLIKDLDGSAKQEFQRLTSLDRTDFTTKADDHAANQNLMYTVAVTNKAQDASESGAAIDLASGKEDDGNIKLAEAIKQAMTRSSLTGEPMDAVEIEGRVRFKALDMLTRENEDAAVVQYDKWSKAGAFGPYADNAKKFIDPTMRNVQIRNDSRAIAAVATKDGIYDTNVAIEAADMMNAKSPMAPKDFERLKENLVQFGEADLRRRNKLADETMAQLTVWQSADSATLGVKRDPEAFLAIPGVQEALRQATPEKRMMFEDRLRRGPAHSNPDHKATLTNILAVADPQAMMAVNRWDYSVSQSDWDAFDKERRTTDKPIDKKIYDTLLDERNSDRTRPPLPRATAADKTLSSTELAEVQEFDARAKWVTKYLKEPAQREILNKDPNQFSILVRKGFEEASRPVTITVDGEEIETTVAGQNAFPTGFPVTEEMMKEAGVTSMDSPNARARIIRVHLQKQESEAQRQADIDLNARLRADGRPVTDAEMKAHRIKVAREYRDRLEPIRRSAVRSE